LNKEFTNVSVNNFSVDAKSYGLNTPIITTTFRVPTAMTINSFYSLHFK